MRFYLGTHEASWLARVDVPLFVSHRRLAGRRSLPCALAPWALDSGGFTELSMHGRWTTSEAEYVEAVARYQEEIGQLEWAAPMDWMCEPHMVERTGLSVCEHQERTVENYLSLRGRGPFVPVLQGWEPRDYEMCALLYEDAGVDLTAERLVGLGSVCRRQHENEIGALIRSLSPLRLHGFGIKRTGLRNYGPYLASADSMAWSYRARNSWPLPGCTHKSCANCPRFALRWREAVLQDLGQMTLWSLAHEQGRVGG